MASPPRHAAATTGSALARTPWSTTITSTGLRVPALNASRQRASDRGRSIVDITTVTPTSVAGFPVMSPIHPVIDALHGTRNPLLLPAELVGTEGAWRS